MRKNNNTRKLATLAVAIIAVAALAVVSCSKEKQCRCIYTPENPDDKTDTTFVYVDPMFSCSKVTQIGYEFNNRTQIKSVTCTRVKKKDLDVQPIEM